uniref:Secreted protein n=1 Tax=Haptolina ericina TaxID=156174 RepID=A0A7S3BK06_9EUKA
MYLSMLIAAMHPSAAATTTCLCGLLRISPIAQTPGTLVAISLSTLTPPSSLTVTFPSRKSVIGLAPAPYMKTPSSSNRCTSMPECEPSRDFRRTPVTPDASPSMHSTLVLLQCFTFGCASSA